MKHLFRALLLAALLISVAPVSHAQILNFAATLTGPDESPPNASPGFGDALVTVDQTLNTMRVQVTFSGLLGTTTASHIHAATAAPLTGTAIVATQTPTFTGFPLGVTSGSYDHTFDLTLATTYSSAFVTAHGGTPASAEAALISALTLSEAYLNIHTSVVPTGEIRGFLIPVTAAPEPGSLVLLGVGLPSLVGLTVIKRQRRNA